MLIMCSTLLSFFHKDTSKYAEDWGFTRPHASFKNGEDCSLDSNACNSYIDAYKVLYKPVYISNSCEERNLKLCFAPVVQSIRKLGYVIECRKVSLFKMFLSK